MKKAGKPVVRAPLKKEWEFEADGDVIHKTLVEDLVVFASKDEKIQALDVASGRRAWQVEMGKKATLTHDMIVTESVVYVLGEDKTLYAVDARAGVKLWQLQLDKDIWYDPIVKDEMVYLVEDGKLLLAVDAKTGVERWRFSADKKIGYPSVGCGKIFFGSKDKHLYAIDVDTGQKQWKFKTGKKDHSRPAVVDGKVLFTADDDLYTLTADTGRLLWKFEKFGGLGEPLIVENTLLKHGDLTFVDLETGEEKKTMAPGLALFVEKMEQRTLYTKVGGALCALDRATGSLKWYAVIETRWPYTFDFSVSEDFVFAFAYSSQKLYGINLSKFTKRWVLEGPYSAPLLTGDRAIIVWGGKKVCGYTSSEASEAKARLEVYDEVTVAPEFTAYLWPSKGTLMEGEVSTAWPNCCCLCCGPVEKRVDLWETKDRVFLDVGKVPYCEKCYKSMKGFFRRESKGVEIVKTSPPILAFRNEKYWAMFMEANRLK